MVWGLAAALAAGISNSLSLLWLFLPISLLAFFQQKRIRIRFIVAAAAALLLFLYGKFSTEFLLLERFYAQEIFSAGGKNSCHVLEGWVSGFPQAGRGRTVFLLRTQLGGKPINLLVYAKTPGINYGDSLRIVAKWADKKKSMEGLSSEDTYLLARGASASVRVGKDGLFNLPGSAGNSIKRYVFWPLHDRLRQTITRSLGSKSGISLALLLGEKGGLDKRIKRTFIDLGISHLLALSGMHLGLIAGAILMLFRVLRIKSRLALFLLLGFYVSTVGEVVSLYRAFTMASVLIAAAVFHRRLDPVDALGKAAFLILLWSPRTLFSVGFQLSFLATLAVLLCIRGFRLPRGRNFLSRVKNFSISTIVVGIFVQVYIAPLLIHHFGRLSVVSPVATLLFFPFVFAVLLLSFLCSIPGAAWSGAGDIFVPPLELVSEAFRKLLLLAGDVAPPLVRIPKADVFLYCAGATLIWRSGGRRWRVFFGLLLVAAAFAKPFLSAE